ncbi:MAG: hypothetical protein IKO53_06785 [Lachnospiraceae bacterium]|nr:hypothetical protein [Lachnospiraceae bacterium]MBR4543901.1 hypothetical protein [Lachnospiraceae bacterium]
MQEKRPFISIVCLTLCFSLILGMYGADRQADHRPVCSSAVSGGISFENITENIENVPWLENELIRLVRPVVHFEISRNVRSLSNAELLLFILFISFILILRSCINLFYSAASVNSSSYFIIRYIQDQDGQK